MATARTTGELCNRREDLFVNGRVYQRTPSRHGLGSGQWYYDDGRAWLADDPTGQLVELSVTPVAFAGAAEDVVLEHLIVEKYASDAQQGAINLDRARGWLIADVTARWNHGIGLFFGPETRISGGSFSHNGQLGIGGDRRGLHARRRGDRVQQLRRLQFRLGSRRHQVRAHQEPGRPEFMRPPQRRPRLVDRHRQHRYGISKATRYS